MKKLLYYFNDEEDGFAIKRLCLSQGIKTKAISPRDFDLPLGSLFGMTVMPEQRVNLIKKPDGYKMPDFFIMFGFDTEALDDFLDSYQDRGISPDALKSVATMFNLGWNSYMLAVELIKERNSI